MSTKISLNYPVISNDHEVWMVRPGASYRLARAFSDAEAFAPDIPLLSLRDGVLAADAADLDAQIRRGRAWREWESRGAHADRMPFRAVGDYVLPINDDAWHTRFLNTVVTILDEIPHGSLVFIPGANLDDQALIGIAESSTADRPDVTRRWGDKQLSFQGRKLLNIKRVSMRALPPAVADRRKNRGVIAEKITGNERILLYREYFRSFFVEDGHAFAQFRGGNRPFPAGALSNLVALTRFAIEASEEREIALAQKREVEQFDFAKLALLSWSADADLLIHANVNSPFGRVTFQSLRPALFAAMAFASVAMLNADTQVLADLENGTATVENTCTEVGHVAAAANEQAALVGQTLYDFYAIFGAETCKQVLEVTRQTFEATQGEVDAEAERGNEQ